MYGAYFSLSSAPFAVTPDPRYVYLSKRHREALAHLQYGVRQPGGFVQLTGEVGTGKTTLCRCLLEQLPPETDVALVLNPRLGVAGFLAAICDEFHIHYPTGSLDTIKGLVDALHAHLLEAHSRGRRPVLIIDEAQNLSPAVLEQVRLLTNLETPTEKLLQIVLIGQPELRRLLERRDLRQLAQRITARYHLLPLTLAETTTYIRHRLRIAGGNPSLFTPAALTQVYRIARGIPRLINVLCDRALLGTYALGRSRVSGALVRRAGREIQGKLHAPLWLWRLRWAVGLGVAAAALLVLGRWVAPEELLVRWTGALLRSSAPAQAPATATQGPPPPAAAAGALHRGVAEARPAAAPPPPSPRLPDLLASLEEQAGEDAAFAGLYSLWGLPYRRPASGSGCDAARSRGLECLSRSGSWSKIRRYDLPVLLAMTLPGGIKRQVALVGLGDDSVTLGLPGGDRTFPLAEADRYWEGQFLLLWPPPPHGSRLLSPGMRGEEIRWLRRALDAAEGKRPAAAPSDQFDTELASRVQSFQRGVSLAPDGIVGLETLVYLAQATRKPGTPSLSARASR